MTFRSQLLIALGAAIGLVAVTLGVGMNLSLRQALQRQVDDHLSAAAASLAAELDSDLARLASEARVVAAEPRLRAVLGTPGMDSATRNEVAEELRAAVGWDILGLADPDGAPLALLGSELQTLPPQLHAAATNGSPVVGFWHEGPHLFLVAAMPVAFGENLVALIYGGRAIVDATAVHYSELHEAAVAFVGPQLYAASFASSDPRRSDPTLLSAASGSVVLAGEPYFARSATLAPELRAVLLESENAALAPYRKLRWTLVLAVLLSLAAAGAGSWWLARRISQPVADLVAVTRSVAAGKLDVAAPPASGELGALASSFNTMVAEIARARDELKRNEALRRDLEIAQNIQVGVLPIQFSLPGFNAAARIRPAAEMGGDFFDLVPTGESFWLVIGDVSGHGLDAGLITLMAQAAAHAAIVANPNSSPAEIVRAVNRLLYENVSVRMHRDDYVTLMVAHHLGGGRFTAAGGHQPVFIARETGVERLDVNGPWCGLTTVADLEIAEFGFAVGPSDALCLITDGIVEAAGAGGELYGDDRLIACLQASRTQAPQAIVDGVFAAVDGFASGQEDDMTVLILKPFDRGAA